jgi:DNA-binding NtrC family response regulator
VQGWYGLRNDESVDGSQPQELSVQRKPEVKEFSRQDSIPDWITWITYERNAWESSGGNSHENANDISVVSDFAPTSIYGVPGGAGRALAGALIGGISNENLSLCPASGLLGHCEGVTMSAAPRFITQSEGNPTVPATNGLFPRSDKSLMYESGQARASFLDTIVGRHGGLREVLSQVEIVAPTSATVLISGETGTGKELIARAIHELSPRRNRNLVKLNCAAIPSGLLESELFGHERGAFTGALMQKKGRFELADGGSLFLDEIGDIPLELQPKLLRAVQEQEFERLGSTRTIEVNVRMIAATHRDLPAMIRESKFREDLFYRLNVFPIAIAPLRERRDDIPLLVNYFVSKLSRQMGRQIKTIPACTMEVLTNQPWRGNVRELANFIERAVILSQGEKLEAPMAELKASHSRQIASISTFENAERAAIIDALKAASGQIAGKGGAAEQLALKRTTLQNKMRKLNISRADYSSCGPTQ